MATINPFQGPINYSVDVQSPFEAALGGVKLGAGVAEIQAAQQKRELESKALAQAQAAQTELKTLFNNPNATSADYARVTAFLPKDQAAIVQQGFEAQTKEQQQNTLRSGAQVYTAIKSGNLPVAEMRLKEQAEALRNVGKEKEAQGYDDLSNLIRLNPTGAQTTIALTIAGLPGGKEFLENADKTLATMRAETLAPEVLREQKAKSDKAVQEAKNAVDTAEDDVAKAAAQRKLEEEKVKQEAIKTQIADATQAAAQAQIIAESDKARGDADKAVADATTAQATAANAAEKAAADAKLATAQAAKAAVEAKYADQLALLGIRKTESDIAIAKENARIAALNATLARETNNLKRQELQQKIDESKEKRDATDREQRALVSNQSADIDNFLNTAQRVINTPKDVIKSATGPVASRLPTLSADVSDFEALIEALGSQAFIAQIPKIKGTGSLSEKEGDKLQASLQTLSLKQSPERLIENVNEAVRLLKKVRGNLSLKYGTEATPIDTPAATEATVSLPNGQTLKFPNRAAADAFKKKAGL
jgi:hypothetical protein